MKKITKPILIFFTILLGLVLITSLLVDHKQLDSGYRISSDNELSSGLKFWAISFFVWIQVWFGKWPLALVSLSFGNYYLCKRKGRSRAQLVLSFTSLVGLFVSSTILLFSAPSIGRLLGEFDLLFHATLPYFIVTFFLCYVGCFLSFRRLSFNLKSKMQGLDLYKIEHAVRKRLESSTANSAHLTREASAPVEVELAVNKSETSERSLFNEQSLSKTATAKKVKESKSGKKKRATSYSAVMGKVSLGQNKFKNFNPDENYFTKIIDRLHEKLGEFKIDGEIINTLKGPVVDTFELELGPGVKVSKVTSATEDLSLALHGAPIRIVYPMKGKTTVGIEVPRNPREIIYLDEIFQEADFKKTKARLPLAMGKDAFGEVAITDLASMPHMLVAGSTGAGKSVFINSILVSLLVKRSPEEMKLILIDPKQLELALYDQLPHLIMPVITDSKKATLALLWAVEEMEKRYTLLKDFGVRNIEGFNSKLDDASDEQLMKIAHHFDSGKDYKLPYLVIIVDEFADLILTKSGKEIENNICRLAAKARAAGIHLILATQRPSVDVITGLIKSNFPTRVSFRVTTSVDSRTILNAMGAEKLLGKGDMLLKQGVETNRLHSAFVEEDEIERFCQELDDMGTSFNQDAIDFLESEGQPDEGSMTYLGMGTLSSEKGESDPLYTQAVDIVMEAKGASASMLQRRLKIGYNRAANIVDEMERQGIVGPSQGAKMRQILPSTENTL